jgi:hypothetical protein
MGTSWEVLNDKMRGFVESQKMFFVATAGRDGTVNVSPKGLDSLKVMSENRVIWLNLTGSGNETAAHVLETPRMTLMFCAFEGNALILRIYGKAKVLHPRSEGWDEAIAHFPTYPSSRQIFDLSIDKVQGSCGTGVPFMDFKKHRGEEEMLPFFSKMGEEGVQKYWKRKNAVSNDGKPTGLFKDEESLGESS